MTRTQRERIRELEAELWNEKLERASETLQHARAKKLLLEAEARAEKADARVTKANEELHAAGFKMRALAKAKNGEIERLQGELTRALGAKDLWRQRYEARKEGEP